MLLGLLPFQFLRTGLLLLLVDLLKSKSFFKNVFTIINNFDDDVCVLLMFLG